MLIRLIGNAHRKVVYNIIMIYCRYTHYIRCIKEIATVYNSDMKSVLIRFPDDVYAALVEKARKDRRNVTQQIVHAVEANAAAELTEVRSADSAKADKGTEDKAQ